MNKDKLIRLLDDCHVSYMEYGNHHCRAGWIQICCPFCIDHDTGYHLGINLEGGYGNCYRCGFHHINAILARVTGAKHRDVLAINKSLYDSRKPEINALKDSVLPFVCPGYHFETKLLRPYQYLCERFPDRSAMDVIHDYDIRYTTGLYMFKTIGKEGNIYASDKYASKIVFPNYLNGNIVSFQCRSFHPDEKGYITAKPVEELVHHKEFLWGIDKVVGNAIIVCEAVFDAITIGAGAVHTHGCNFTKNQADELATFDKVYIAYDMDNAGRDSSRKLASYLSHKTNVSLLYFGKNVEAKDINDLLKTDEGIKELADIRALLTSD